MTRYAPLSREPRAIVSSALSERFVRVSPAATPGQPGSQLGRLLTSPFRKVTSSVKKRADDNSVFAIEAAIVRETIEKRANRVFRCHEETPLFTPEYEFAGRNSTPA